VPQGDKSSYSGKQKRQARKIEKGYEKRGVSAKTAAKRAWATVNKQTGGAAKKKSARKKTATKKTTAKKSTKTTARKSTVRSKAAKKAARTRARRNH
jgi:hypothetical protein